MTSSINMGTHEITNLAEPTGNSNAATKRYVDGVDTKVRNNMSQEVIQIQNLLNAKIDIGEIDQKTQKIVNLGAPSAISDAATKGYVDSAVFNGDMLGNKIVNLGDPVNLQDAATKSFVETSLVSQSGLQQNVFLFQMTDVLQSSSESNITVNGILKFPNTPHTLFKTAYNFTIGKNAFNEYNARIGFNFNPVSTGEYTYAVEYFPPTKTNVTVDCRSTPLNVNKQIFKKFPDYVKNIVQIHKWQMATPDFLMIDLKSVGDVNSPAQGEGWLIVYGIEGKHNDVPSSILDTTFTITNGDMLLQAPINMNKNTIKNLPLPTEASQAASKEYVDISGIYSILSQATTTFIDGNIKQNAECLYSVERATKEELVYSSSTRVISTLFDQTLSGLNATQSTVARRPKLSTTKNAKRYYFTFDGNKRMLSNINLNPASGANDIVHVFILFQLATMAGSN